MTDDRKRLALTVAAIGVVFGDIGTSPLYALRECFAPVHGLAVTEANVIGVVSLLIWVITLIVSVKYIVFVLRADNKGDGGILSLISLVARSLPSTSRRRVGVITILGIIGAALLYSDGIITPSISVLSAVEGLETLAPSLGTFVVPLALVILILLYSVQARGTERVGGLFGPIISLWFLTIGVLGIVAAAGNPAIFAALNPVNAILFVFQGGSVAFRSLGSIFLGVTGAEVLYADLGHFGRPPIRRAWFGLVYPALMLNYMGQGAFLLHHPGAVENLFFRLVPTWGLPLLILIATAASIIASQAVISGAFSLARQSVQLGFWPRIQVRHTSDETVGQVYVPFIKWFLLFGTVALVLGFRSSDKLANAYGIAVSADMVITSALMVYVSLRIWKKGSWYRIPFLALFLAIEGTFLVSNLSKVASGGWIVVVLAVTIFFLMKTWVDGRRSFSEKMRKFRIAPEIFAESIKLNPPHRVHGTAVFLTGDPGGVPKALLHNLRHNRVLHDRTILLSVLTLDLPRVDEEERCEVTELEAGIWKIVINYGFSETPDVQRSLRTIEIPGFSPDAMDTTYFVGRESIVRGKSPKGLAFLRMGLFRLMFMNALNATDFFRLPADRIIELGARTEL